MAKGLGKSAAILTVSKVVTTLMSVVTAMLLSRFRTLQEYGTYSQLLIVMSLATSIFLLGLPNSTNYFLARCDTHEERQHFLSVYYTLNTLLCFVMGGVLGFATPAISSYFDNQMIEDFAYFLVVFPWVSVSLNSIGNVLVVYNKTGKLMLFNVVNTASTLASVLFVQSMGWSFYEYVLVNLLVDVALAVWVYAMVWNLEKPLYVSLDRELIAQILTYSVPIGLAGVVGTLSVEIDKLLIGWFFNTEELAIYSNAARELPFTIVATSLAAVLLPNLARLLKGNRNDEAAKLWCVSIELSFTIMAVIVAGIFTFAGEAMELLYSAKYLPGVPVFRIYTLMLLLRVTYFGMMLNACGETKTILWCSVLTLALNVVTSPIFYCLFGMVGPALATFFSIFAVQPYLLKLTSKAINVPFSSIYPWKRVGVLLLMNAVFAIVFLVLRQILPFDQYVGHIGEALLLGMVWVLAYFLLVRKRLLTLWHTLNAGGE